MTAEERRAESANINCINDDAGIRFGFYVRVAVVPVVPRPTKYTRRVCCRRFPARDGTVDGLESHAVVVDDGAVRRSDNRKEIEVQFETIRPNAAAR